MRKWYMQFEVKCSKKLLRFLIPCCRGWTDGRMDRRTDGQMDGRTDGHDDDNTPRGPFVRGVKNDFFHLIVVFAYKFRVLNNLIHFLYNFTLHNHILSNLCTILYFVLNCWKVAEIWKSGGGLWSGVLLRGLHLWGQMWPNYPEIYHF